MTISFVVPGTPRGKGRPRFTKAGHAYTPEETEVYESLVRLAYKQAAPALPPMTGPISIMITAVMPIPASLSEKRREAMVGERHGKKPDLDNVVKAVLDGLNGVAFADDAHVCQLIAGKVYGISPGLNVSVKSDDQ